MSRLFYLLFLLVPLVLFTKTSELFEFNKTIVLYIISILIISNWAIKCVKDKRVIFKRTILDFPILIFLGSQIISTLLSLDIRTSLYGYYSRFNGGLIPTITYILLYWAFVSNIKRSETLNLLKIAIISGVIVCTYGILQHFGIDKDIWIQDVQTRIFSTFGQPNWLAAWLVATIPFCLYFYLNFKSNLYKIILFIVINIFYITLLYTKSRSGLLAFVISMFTFWFPIIFVLQKNLATTRIKSTISLLISLVVITSIIGTPWTPNINSLLFKKVEVKNDSLQQESLGSESGEIRKVVWKGAIEIWKNYPVFGSGVETFAFSYYRFKPIEHNLLSEWDYLYNKAHNEYLNYLATTGIVGFSIYIILILTIITKILMPLLSKNQGDIDKILNLSLLASFVSILITNFFGFSVVAISLYFFLIPAFNNSLEEKSVTKTKLGLSQFIGLVIILIITFLGIYQTIKYWVADYYYSQGVSYFENGNPYQSELSFKKAVTHSPYEPIFWEGYSKNTGFAAATALSQNDLDMSKKLADIAYTQAQKAVLLSPQNVNLKRNLASVEIKMSEIDSKYLSLARKTLQNAILLAPTDPKLMYNLALVELRFSEIQKSLDLLDVAIKLKPNYKEPRFAKALILIDSNEKDNAKLELEYILENIDPKDEKVIKTLESI